TEYAFLWYLVEQHEAGESDWLERPPNQPTSDIWYVVKQSRRLEQMFAAFAVQPHRVVRRGSFWHVKAEAVTEWSSRINRAWREHFDGELVVNTGVGPPSSQATHVRLRQIDVWCAQSSRQALRTP